jgi:fucokinase
MGVQVYGQKEELAASAQRARRLYAERVAMDAGPQWWTAVVITASSQRQAERYQWEVNRRKEQGKLPGGVEFVAVPDLDDRRIGSGGATINGLRGLVELALAKGGLADGGLEQWWNRQRVLMIHSGGDSRRLPQYSLSGKLFSALPVKTPWGEVSTVFDELLALSSSWAEVMPGGLLVGSGDVILIFDAQQLDWAKPGVCGVAILQPASSGTQHGVYIADEQGRVYSYLQKPSIAEVRAAGGLRAGGRVALDAGLLRFDPAAASKLTRLAGLREAEGKSFFGPNVLEQTTDGRRTEIDLYQHVTMALTGQWEPRPEDSAALKTLHAAMHGVPFWCSTVEGEFTHVGTTTLYRKLMTEETEFSRLYEVQQSLGVPDQTGVRSAGVVIDSVLDGGGQLGPGALVIECNLRDPLRVSRGAVAHGLEGITGAVEIPDDTVSHQVGVILPDGTRGTVIRVYGVGDDPNAAADSRNATWLGEPMLEGMKNLGLERSSVWMGLPPEQWSLWNARLFPVTTVEEAWACAQWMMRLPSHFTVERWNSLPRLSLASSTEHADANALLLSHSQRLQANWKALALRLAEEGSDIRPLLVRAPGISLLAGTARSLRRQAELNMGENPTEAASRYYQAGMFFGQAGLEKEASECRAGAFGMVEQAVQRGAYTVSRQPAADGWKYGAVEVSAPARIDFGGGWSDTPPFCLDWGGAVLNAAIELQGGYPIKAQARRLRERVIRCVVGDTGQAAEYREMKELLGRSEPGNPFSISRTALQMTGLFREGEELEKALDRLDGGLELRTDVDLPMGSGLGTSSVLGAAVLRALSAMTGETPSDQVLSDRVMQLEQLMSTGGGWQDQAGGIFPGVKLLTSGPGLRQRLRVQPVKWSGERAAEFESLMVLYYTGIRRIAKDLLKEVVGSYLARETAAVQVLHSIKTLAMEMSHAMQEGEWDYLGQLLDRHWALNQILDPNTTNALINGLLESVRPYIRGVKLAGAGGGGFLMLLSKGPEEAAELRRHLEQGPSWARGAVYNWKISSDGLRVVQG